MRWLDFHISYECLNNCIFCSEYDRIQEFKNSPLSLKEIKTALLIKKKENFDYVCFTGGEPSIYKHFLEVLQFAKKLKYIVGVTTNTIPFASPKFCEQTLPYIDELQVSVHGYNEATHNFHTKNKESFGNVKKSLTNLNATPINFRLSANVMVTKHNLNYLLKIIKFLGSFNRMKHILISNIAPEGNGLHNFSDISVKLTDLAEKLPPIVSYCEEKKIILKIFGAPLCILGKYKIYSNDLFWEQRITLEKGNRNGKIELIPVKGYTPTRDRVKTQKCEKCLFRSDSICGGIIKKYAEEYGTDEIKPMKQARVKGIGCRV